MFHIVDTGLARTPGAPLNGTVRAGRTLYMSHIPKDPETAAFIGGSFEAQARRAFANLKQSVEAAGGTLADVTQIVMFLVDREDFAAMNEIYREFFADPFPNRSVVVVKELIAPGMLIEFLAYAHLGD